MKIAKITAREIFDSRGMPTIECELILENGSTVTASVPSGLSRGANEAFELRDGGQRLMGKGVLKVIENIEGIIAPALVGKEPDVISMDLELIERDGTANRSKLGANTMLAVSIAVARAQAVINEMELYELIAYLCDHSSVTLPFPMFNIINGGVHTPESNLRIQEIMVVPVGAQSFRICLESVVMLYNRLKVTLKKKKKCVSFGDEGGLSADFFDDQEALDILMGVIEKEQKESGNRFVLALDIAASQFYNRKKNLYDWAGNSMGTQQLIELYTTLVAQYPIYSLEDGLSEHDYEGWQALTKELSGNVQLIGDDLFCTNPLAIVQGIEQRMATGVVIKPNQVGTVTETLQAIKLCSENDLISVVSHRSGETNDTFIVDLAVGTSSGYVKAGGITRGERLAKYNEFLRIEDELMFSLLDS